MGSHECEFCKPADAGKFKHRRSSSSDIVLQIRVTSKGKPGMGQLSGLMAMAQPKEVVYIMPQMVPHYLEHGWVPPQDFMDAVMNGELLGFDWHQTRNLGGTNPIRVGYLSGEIPKQGTVPNGFAEKIWSYIQQAAAAAGYQA